MKRKAKKKSPRDFQCWHCKRVEHCVNPLALKPSWYYGKWEGQDCYLCSRECGVAAGILPR